MKYSTSWGLRVATASAAVALTGAFVLPQAAFAVSSAGYVWPLRTTGTVTQQFGHDGHTGTDIAAKRGADVLAMADGTVKYVQSWDGHSKSGMQSYGNLVIVYHPSNKMATYYAHLSDVSVREGQAVKQGQVIGHVGSTGNSTGNHLHVETRKNAKSAQGTHGKGDGTCVNTLDYVSPSDATPTIPAAPAALAGSWGTDTTDLPEGYTVIRLKDTDLALTVTGDGNDGDNGRKVRVTTADGSASQQWKFEPQGDGSFKLRSAAYDVVLDIRNGSTSNGAEVWTWASNDAPEERFYAERIEGNDYALRNAKSNLYVNIGDRSTVKSGDKVTLWAGRSGDGRAADQTWTIEGAGPSKDSDTDSSTGADADTQATTDENRSDDGDTDAGSGGSACSYGSADSGGSAAEPGTDSGGNAGADGGTGSSSANGNGTGSGSAYGSAQGGGFRGSEDPGDHSTDHDAAQGGGSTASEDPPQPHSGNEGGNDTGGSPSSDANGGGASDPAVGGGAAGNQCEGGAEADGSRPSIWDGLMRLVGRIRRFFESL